MGEGMMPNDMKYAVHKKVKEKHILISLPGESIKRNVISKDSLLYLAYFLGKEYVRLPGFGDNAVKVSSLSPDILRAKVLMYKFDTYKTFTAIIDGSGYMKWAGEGNK